MKQTNLVCREPRYPNAADNRYFAAKALDILMGIVCVGGFVCAMFFLAVIA